MMMMMSMSTKSTRTTTRGGGGGGPEIWDNQSINIFSRDIFKIKSTYTLIIGQIMKHYIITYILQYVSHKRPCP